MEEKPVQLEYDRLDEETILLLNYSAKPKLIFKHKEESEHKEESIGDYIIGKIINIDEYGDVYWTKEHKDNSKQCHLP